MNFVQVEKKVAKLRQELAAGRLTEEECKAQMRDLMVEDKEGNWWMVGYETGEWYRHDGDDWTRADPPGHTVPRSPPAAPPAQTLSEPTPRPSAQTDVVSPRTIPSRDVKTVAWWLLGISVLLALGLGIVGGQGTLPTNYEYLIIIFASGTGIVGIVGAIGMLKEHSWGRKLGLVSSILFQVAGFVLAVGNVISLFSPYVFRGANVTHWSLFVAAIVEIIAGIILTHLLGQESIIRRFGEESKRPPGIWPIAIPMALTLIGAVPAVGLLRNRRWARWAMMVFLCVLALTSIVGAIAAGPEMRHYWFENGKRLYDNNEWGFAIVLTEAAVMVIWCAVAFFYLKSPRVSVWFQDHSG